MEFAADVDTQLFAGRRQAPGGRFVTLPDPVGEALRQLGASLRASDPGLARALTQFYEPSTVATRARRAVVRISRNVYLCLGTALSMYGMSLWTCALAAAHQDQELLLVPSYRERVACSERNRTPVRHGRLQR